MNAGNRDEKIIAKGLGSPGPLLLVKKYLKNHSAKRIRVIVSDRAAADELVSFFSERNAVAKIDLAGDDLHVIVDLSSFKDGD